MPFFCNLLSDEKWFRFHEMDKILQKVPTLILREKKVLSLNLNNHHYVQ